MTSDTENRASTGELKSVIFRWLKNRLEDSVYRKIEAAFIRLREEAEDWEVFSSFSSVPRYSGKEDLHLDTIEEADANRLRPGWRPGFWTTDQLCRTLLLLAVTERGKNEFLDKFEKLFVSADMGESVALYQSLPVLPWPGEFRDRAAEGIRSNITSVFNAVALQNPYPADHLHEDAWNQMVLKALFIGSPLWLIHGIDRRANPNLARMLVHFAHERWAAGRNTPPELWRPASPFLDDKTVGEMQRLLDHPDDIQKQAAVLALSAAGSPAATELLNKYSTVKDIWQETTWDEIGRKAAVRHK